jgi:maltose-binding protein MalE
VGTVAVGVVGAVADVAVAAAAAVVAAAAAGYEHEIHLEFDDEMETFWGYWVDWKRAKYGLMIM